METLTEKPVAEIPMFKKKRRIGLYVLDIKDGKTWVLSILALETKLSKKFKKDLPIFHVIDYGTGEEGIIFIDGGIKGACGGEDKLELLVGKDVAITHKGYKKLTDDEDAQEVNVWDIFEVELEK